MGRKISTEKRILAFCLCILMCINLLPAQVFAIGLGDTTQAAEMQETKENPAEALPEGDSGKTAVEIEPEKETEKSEREDEKKTDNTTETEQKESDSSVSETLKKDAEKKDEIKEAEKTKIEPKEVASASKEENEDVKYPSLSLLQTDEDKASSFIFSDENAKQVEALLGYEVKAASSRGLFKPFSSSPYRFDAYYILYQNNNATTKTDTIQDLIGNMSATEQVIKYQIDFHNDTNYAIGEVEFRVPYAIYLNRYGEAVIPSDLGVPMAPGISKVSSFNYVIDDKGTADPMDDEMVFTNCKEIVSGSNNLLQIFYSLDDMATIDETTWKIAPVLTIKGQKQNINIKLTGSMDTKTVLNLVDKQAYEPIPSLIYPELYTISQIESLASGMSIPDNIKNNFDDYRYLLFRTEVQGYADQPWDLTIVDAPGNNGIVIGQFATTADNPKQTKLGDTCLGDTLQWQDMHKYNLNYISNKQTIYIWSVVAYPVADAELAANELENTITVTMTGKDDNISHVLSDSVSTHWDPYEWIYKGDVIGVDKLYGGQSENAGTYIEQSWLTAYKENKAVGMDTALPRNWTVCGTLRGYDLIYPLIYSGGQSTGKREDNSATDNYTLVTVDDFQYVMSNTAAYAKMDYLDYYYESVNVQITDYDVDIYEDKQMLASSGRDTTVWVMAADNPNVWQQVAVVPYIDAVKGYKVPQEWLDKGVYRIKAEHTANGYATYCNIAGKTALRATSPVIAELLQDSDTTSITVQNLGGVYGTATSVQGYIQSTDESQYGPYASLGLLQDTKDLYGTVLMRDNRTVRLTSLQETNDINKTGTGVNDPLNSRVKLTYQITAYDGYTVYGNEIQPILEDAGISPERDSVTIYDFLPAGIRFNPEQKVTVGQLSTLLPTHRNVAKSWKQEDVEVTYTVTDDYNGSGRQLVAFHLTYTGNDNTIFYTSVKSKQWITGWGVEFGAYYEWKDAPNCNSAQNIAAFQTEDTMKGTAYADDGSGAPTSANGYLHDLDGDNDQIEKNVIYGTCAVDLANAVATLASIQKLVKEDANLYGTPEIDASGVEVGQTYSYYIDISTGNNSLKDIVIFDWLESAPKYRADNETKAFDANYWYGTFVKTNIDTLTDRGIAVKVYYSFDRDEAISVAGLTGQQVLTQGGWMESNTVPAALLADVKAIAFDLTTTTGGDPYELAALDSLSLSIQMRAPQSLQNSTEYSNNSAEDPSSPATYAYNNPAYYGTATVAGGQTSDTVIGNSTSIKLYGQTTLSIEKSELLGEGAPTNEDFTFLVTIDNVPYTYREYTLYENGVKQSGIFATDISGKLKLKYNQKAVFEGAPAGRPYKIEELTTHHWKGSAINAEGILEEGTETAVKFSNQYLTLVYFEKKVEAVPKGEGENDEFTFEMYLDGAIAANQTYYLVNTTVAMNREPVILDTLQTDANGQFKLKAGQRIFVSLEPGTDYKFVEVAGFGNGTNYTCENPIAEGTAQGDYVSESITNRYRWKSLYIKKTVPAKRGIASNPNEEFLFTVMIEGSIYANGAYELYDENDVLLDDTLATDGNGQLKLKAGQTARVKKLAPGALWTVTETLTAAQQEDYIIASPESGSASGKLPTYATSSTTEFVNATTMRELEVSKTVLFDAATEAAATAQEFTFTISIDMDGDGIAAASETYGNKNYVLVNTDGTETNQTTTAAGTFTLKHGQSAIFPDLKIGTAYKIDEATAAGYTQVLPLNNAAIEGEVKNTLAPTSVNFQNAADNVTYLAFTKKMQAGEGISEEQFQAALENEKNYLVNTSRTSLYETGPLISVFQIFVNGVPYNGSYKVVGTDGAITEYTRTFWNTSGLGLGAGHVFLKPGETILITGLSSTDTYKIEELNDALTNDIFWQFENSGLKLFIDGEDAIAASVDPVYPATGIMEGTVDSAPLEFINEVSTKIGYIRIEKYVDNQQIERLDQSKGAKFIGETLTLQLLEPDGSGGWKPAAGVSYYDGNNARYQNMHPLGLTDSEGKIRMTGRQVSATDPRLAGFSIIVKGADIFDGRHAYPGGYHPTLGQVRYKIVEVKEETSDVFGELLGMSLSSYDGGPNVTIKNVTTGTSNESFKVEKKVEGIENLDTEFAFTLSKTETDGMGDPLTKDLEVVAFKGYRLFNSATDEEITDDAPYETDANGMFYLKNGQYAKFEGMDEGTGGAYSTIYRIDEAPMNGYSTAIEYEGHETSVSNSYWDLLNITERTSWIQGGYTLGVTYTNTYNPVPNLKIRKRITADAGVEMPWEAAYTQFTFAVSVDGKPYANEEYRVFDASSGTESFNTKWINGQSVKLPWTTNQYGEFEMEESQYVVFEWVGAGKQYEITEMPVSGFTQIQPATGSSITGIMTNSEKTETFINHYGGTETTGQTGKITVRKGLVFPAGLQLPDDLEFTFHIEVGGLEYAAKGFTTYNNNGTVASTIGSTDAFGNFKLKAGQYAVFDNVAIEQDYEVSEVIDANADYYLIMESGTVGATTASGVAANFTNGLAAFMVEKQVVSTSGQTPPADDEFTFVATVNGAPHANAEYWLYNASGAKIGTETTDANGQFTLKASQKALFIGIPRGASYQVAEQSKLYYTQTIPSNPAGYTGTVDDTVASLIFENNYEQAAVLSVVKKVSGLNGATAPASAEFTFQITVGGALHANKVYYIGAQSYRTDAEGKFKLKANEAAIFKNIRPGVLYTVEEVDMPIGFSTANASYSGAANAAIGAEIEFQNVYKEVNIWVENTTGDDTADPADDNLGGSVKVDGPYGTAPNTVSSDGADDNTANRKASNAVSGTPDTGWIVDIDNIKVGPKGSGSSGATQKISDLPNVTEKPIDGSDFYNPSTGEFQYTPIGGDTIKEQFLLIAIQEL